MEYQFEKQEQIYNNTSAKVTVYKCKEVTQGFYVALKEQGFKNKQQADTALREYRIQSSLSHPNICKVYAFYQEPRETDVYNILAIEWMDKQDLYKDIQNRKKNAFPWTEEELWGHFQAIIGALAYAQRASISHRDIKPQNLFINSRNEIKIGDFGSSTQSADSGGLALTVVGTPFFLSPKLREAYLTGKMNQRVEHNPYKSDVYSLGVTFLIMALLEAPQGIGVNVSEEMVSTVIEGLCYSDNMKAFFKWMLMFDEAARPDFLMIEMWLHPEMQVPESNPGSEGSEQVIATAPIEQSSICPTCFRSFSHASSFTWTQYLDGYTNYCSRDCYLLMRQVYGQQHDSTDTYCCLFCRRWTNEIWSFACEQHGTCSKECLRALIINSTRLFKDEIRCPECIAELDKVMLLRLYTIKDRDFDVQECEALFEDHRRLLAEKRCEICALPAERMYPSCEHAYCLSCFHIELNQTAGFLNCRLCVTSYFLTEDPFSVPSLT